MTNADLLALSAQRGEDEHNLERVRQGLSPIVTYRHPCACSCCSDTGCHCLDYPESKRCDCAPCQVAIDASKPEMV